MSELKDKFKKEITSKLQKELGLKNPMAVPKLSKIVVNMGVNNVISDKKRLEAAEKILSEIVGQKPKRTKAKKSIAAFKLREGEEIGLMTTLRGKRMYDFFEKLVTITLPRIRDFHGLSNKSFDGKGNYAIGFSEAVVFPEIDTGKVDASMLRQGLQVVITTTAKNDEAGRVLLKGLGMPFKK